MDSTQSPMFPTTYKLADGRTVAIRMIQSGDAHLLVGMYHHLSERSRRLRFHAYTGNVPEERVWREAVALSDLDPSRQCALVAVIEDDAGEHAVGVARLARSTPEGVEAEAAVVVRDDFQRLGLGTHLLTSLLPLATSMGIERLFGWVMAENRHMLQIVAKTNLPVHRENRTGEIYVVLSLQ